MGGIRKHRKTYKRPKKRWDLARLQEERRLMKLYGLKRKKELWKAKEILRKFRRTARFLIGKVGEKYEKIKKDLMDKLYRLGLIEKNAQLDDVLDLTVEDILKRRLQTIVYEKRLASTIKQARQLIAHGHIAIGDQKITSPSYLVKRDEEDKVTYYKKSPLTKKNHPIRVGIESKYKE